MKPNSVSKAFSWLIILSLFSCPALKAFEEGIVYEELDEYPALPLIQILDQDNTHFGRTLKDRLYGIGEQFSVMSRRYNMQNAVEALDALTQEALTDEKLQGQFQQLMVDILALHQFLDAAYENEIPQSQAAIIRYLRNLTYGDRFALPVIGVGGAAAGYGTAVVRARFMHRFIELLAAGALGKLGDKMGKAVPHVIFGIFSAIVLFSIFYHLRKYNKLWLKNAVDKKMGGLEKQVKKRNDKFEKKRTKSITTLTAEIVKRDTKHNKRILALEEHDLNMRTQMMRVLANQHAMETDFINQLNPLTDALNGSLGLLTLMMANVDPLHPGYEDALRNKQTIVTALAAMNRELESLNQSREERNKRGFKNKMKKFLTIGRKKKNRSRSGSTTPSTSLALPLLTPRGQLRSPSPGVTITIETPRRALAPTLIVTLEESESSQ